MFMAKTGIFKREAIVIVALFVMMFFVMPILAVIVTVVVAPKLIEDPGTSEGSAAEIAIEKLSGTLDLYRLEVGDYPGDAMGLNALIEQPPNAQGWKGPYVKKPEQLIDPWGRPYIYRYPGEHGAFDLYSLGKDGRVGGDGDDRDVTSWD